jgi:hypothetical protein
MGKGMKDRLGCFAWSGLVALLVLFLVACEKESQERGIIVGPWKETIASYHTIISFRANGSFGTIRLVEGQHSKIDDKAERVKVDGKWQLLPPEVDGDPLLLIMTPEVVAGDTPWEVDTPVTYLIERLTSNRMMLRSPTGERLAWDRLKSIKAPEEEGGISLVHVTTGPLVVALAKERLNEENRYLCLQLDLTLKDLDGVAYVEDERLPSGEPTGIYKLHPSIYEAIVLHLSRLRHRDVRSLKRIGEVVADLDRILTPYMGDRLQEVKVVKVVITSTRDGVDAFVAEFTPEIPATPDVES